MTDKARIKRRLIERDGKNCHYCGKLMRPSIKNFDPEGMSIDHVEPLSKGGIGNIDNLVLACRVCNLKKRTDSYHEFRMGRETDQMILFLMGEKS